MRSGPCCDLHAVLVLETASVYADAKHRQPSYTLISRDTVSSAIESFRSSQDPDSAGKVTEVQYEFCFFRGNW